MTDAEQDLIAVCLEVDAEACAGDYPNEQLCLWLNKIKAAVCSVRGERRESAERDVVYAAERLADEWSVKGLKPAELRLKTAVERMRSHGK